MIDMVLTQNPDSAACHHQEVVAVQVQHLLQEAPSVVVSMVNSAPKIYSTCSSVAAAQWVLRLVVVQVSHKNTIPRQEKSKARSH